MHAFDDLRYVFSKSGTALLSAEDERRLAERMWQGRRRLRLALVWDVPCRAGSNVPPRPAPHRTPLPPPLRKRLLEAEKRAHRALERRRAPEAQHALFERELAAIEESREKLLTHNVRLVSWIAKGFLGKGMELSDLFQEGAIALLWSIDRFDPARGLRLSTYATHAIRCGIVRALSDKGRTIRVPNYRFKEAVRAGSARGKLLQELGREPDAEEMADETAIPRESLDELLAAIRPVASLEAPIAGGDLALSDVLVDTRSPSPLDRLQRLEANGNARRAMARLAERERTIVAMRYGLGGSDERSYEEIGRTLGLSRERTRQLEREARSKLRAMIESGVR